MPIACFSITQLKYFAKEKCVVHQTFYLTVETYEQRRLMTASAFRCKVQRFHWILCLLKDFNNFLFCAFSSFLRPEDESLTLGRPKQGRA